MIIIIWLPASGKTYIANTVYKESSCLHTDDLWYWLWDIANELIKIYHEYEVIEWVSCYMLLRELAKDRSIDWNGIEIIHVESRKDFRLYSYRTELHRKWKDPFKMDKSLDTIYKEFISILWKRWIKPNIQKVLRSSTL